MAAERIRSFVAIDLDAAVLEALRRLRLELAATAADVRWVAPAGLHLTVKFLGSVDRGDLERVPGALREAVGGLAPLPLRVHGLGAFPDLRRPRVVWAGLSGAGIEAVAARVDAALAAVGFAPETRAFRPHITLGRVRSPRGWRALAAVIERRREEEWGETVARALVVYRSDLRREGAVYTALWTVPFGAPVVNGPGLG